MDSPVDTTDALYVPEPPEDLSPEAAERFRRYAGAYPAGWWDRVNSALLVEYVRALEASDVLARRLSVQALEVLDVPSLSQLTMMRDREAKRAIRLATAMRATQQSVSNQRAGLKKLDPGHGSAPWHDDAGA